MSAKRKSISKQEAGNSKFAVNEAFNFLGWVSDPYSHFELSHECRGSNPNKDAPVRTIQEIRESLVSLLVLIKNMPLPTIEPGDVLNRSVNPFVEVLSKPIRQEIRNIIREIQKIAFDGMQPTGDITLDVREEIARIRETGLSLRKELIELQGEINRRARTLSSSKTETIKQALAMLKPQVEQLGLRLSHLSSNVRHFRVPFTDISYHSDAIHRSLVDWTNLFLPKSDRMLRDELKQKLYVYWHSALTMTGWCLPLEEVFEGFPDLLDDIKRCVEQDAFVQKIIDERGRSKTKGASKDPALQHFRRQIAVEKEAFLLNTREAKKE